MKIKIINDNYVHKSERLVLVPSWARYDNPWRAIGAGRIKRFRTHAEAIKYAASMARKEPGE